MSCRYQFCSDYQWVPSCRACEEPPSVVTSYQPFFYPGTSTSGLSSGVTVGGTGSSFVLPSVVTSDQPFVDPGTSTNSLSSGVTVGGTGSSLVFPSVVTSDQPFFDPGTSTSGLSFGVTVGGTGSSLVQTTGEAAQRVDLPEIAVTIETLISPVLIFRLVPVLFRLPVGSLTCQ